MYRVFMVKLEYQFCTDFRLRPFKTCTIVIYILHIKLQELTEITSSNLIGWLQNNFRESGYTGFYQSARKKSPVYVLSGF